MGGKNFYQYNLKFKGQIEKFLELVRDHEMEHSRRMANALRSRDPARDLEKAYGKDAERLREEGESRIRAAAEELHERSKDPLPETGSADLVLPLRDQNEWAIIPTKVGGNGYGSF